MKICSCYFHFKALVENLEPSIYLEMLLYLFVVKVPVPQNSFIKGNR